MLVVFACVAVGVSGDDQEAWEAIYDHWDLGSYSGFTACSIACSCPYYLVTCNAAGEITSLDLKGDNLYLSDNLEKKLSGTIPTEIWKLTQLQDLNLSNNNLSGTIPTEIGQAIEAAAMCDLEDLLGDEVGMKRLHAKMLIKTSIAILKASAKIEGC